MQLLNNGLTKPNPKRQRSRLFVRKLYAKPLTVQKRHSLPFKKQKHRRQRRSGMKKNAEHSFDVIDSKPK